MDPTDTKHLRTTGTARTARASIGHQPAAHLEINGTASGGARFAIQSIAPEARVRRRTGSGGPLAGS